MSFWKEHKSLLSGRECALCVRHGPGLLGGGGYPNSALQISIVIAFLTLQGCEREWLALLLLLLAHTSIPRVWEPAFLS